MADDRQTGRHGPDTAPAEVDERGRTWVKRPLVWLGTLATAVVTAVTITVANHFAGNAVSGGNNAHASSANSKAAYAPYVAVRHEAGFSGGCGSWIVAKPPQAISPPPSNYDLTHMEKWIWQNNAIDASSWAMKYPARYGSVGATNLDVTVQGRNATPVILTGIQFIALRRNPGMIHGGVITNPCGGPMEARYVVANLDNNPIEIVASRRDPFPPRSGEPWLAKPVRFPYYVTDTNGEVFKIIAYAHSDIVWYAKLFWSVEGKNGESIINDGGKPFQTAPLARAKAAYGYNGHQWYVCPSGAQLTCTMQK
jgi:hypothetical protein